MNRTERGDWKDVGIRCVSGVGLPFDFAKLRDRKCRVFIEHVEHIDLHRPALEQTGLYATLRSTLIHGVRPESPRRPCSCRCRPTAIGTRPGPGSQEKYDCDSPAGRCHKCPSNSGTAGLHQQVAADRPLVVELVIAEQFQRVLAVIRQWPFAPSSAPVVEVLGGAGVGLADIGLHAAFGVAGALAPRCTNPAGRTCPSGLRRRTRRPCRCAWPACPACRQSIVDLLQRDRRR